MTISASKKTIQNFIKALRVTFYYLIIFSLFGCSTLVVGSKNKIYYEEKLKNHHGLIYIRTKNVQSVTGVLSSIDEKQIVLFDKRQIYYENIESIRIENKYTFARDMALVPVGAIVSIPLLFIVCIFMDNCRS